jgi:hypothetical protein
MRHTNRMMLDIFIAFMTISGLLFSRLPRLQAAELVANITIGVDCYRIRIELDDKGVVADRDTTGTGFETVILEVRDGAGDIVFSYSSLLSVESRETDSFEPAFDYTRVPLLNPLIARIYSPAGNGFAERELVSTIGYCAGLQSYVGPRADGPGIPDGFVLSTITCDVPVFNMPEGSPVDGSAITVGQTWYVNPEPVTTGNGNGWTEIFTSSQINGFVPTICVT